MCMMVMVVMVTLNNNILVCRLLTDLGWTQCWWVSRYRAQLQHQMVHTHLGGGGQNVIETKNLSRM